MLKIDIFDSGRMTMIGSHLLRGIQNTDTSIIDLLIRESIQNSLDAGYINEDVFYDFSIGDFSKEQLVKHFENTENLLKIKGKNNFIVMSDKNTQGLTGPIHYNDASNIKERSNLLNLVYNIARRQDQKGAGGSWGLGKTVYFRVGIGLVIYYSRIKLSSGRYEERLAATLVEDETKEELIIKGNKNGISWWGSKDHNFSGTIPLTNSQEIKDILRIFNINPYTNDETGTMIIIPFVDEEELFDMSAPTKTAKSYYENLTDYVNYSIQRWYAPRLNNPKYNFGKRNNLIVSVNKERIDNEYEHQFFKVIRAMYNAAAIKDKKDINSLLKYSEIFLEEVRVTKQISKFNSEYVGDFIYGQFDYRDLGMGSIGEISHPLFLTNNFAHDSDKDKTRPPLIMLTRQPGMIINHFSNDSKWGSSIEETSLDKFLIGLFVLNSNESIFFENELDEKVTLEEYIRESEKSDHMEWSDHTDKYRDNKNKILKSNVVKRINVNIKTKISSKFSKVKTTKEKNLVTENISSKIAEMIMPPEGYGTKATPKTKDNSNKEITRKAIRLQSKILYNEIEYHSNNIIKIPFELNMSEKVEEIEFSIMIESTDSKIKVEDYEHSNNLKSPLTISYFEIDRNCFDVIENKTLLNTIYSIKVKKTSNIQHQKGYLELKTLDKKVTPNILIREVIANE